MSEPGGSGDLGEERLDLSRFRGHPMPKRPVAEEDVEDFVEVLLMHDT